MPNFRPLLALAIALHLPACAAVTARQDFASADFGLAYLQPASRAELPTLAQRAFQAELAGFDKAFGRVEGAAKALGGPGATKLRGQAAAVRALLDRDWRGRLQASASQGGVALSERIMAHDLIGRPGYAPIPKAPGDDADSKAANAAIAEAEGALRAVEKAGALAQLARSMAGMAAQDLVDAKDVKSQASTTTTAYAAIAAARLAIEAVAEAGTAEGKLAAAEKRLVAAAANPVVAMRTGAAASRLAGARGLLAAVQRDSPAHLEAAARVLAEAKALK